MSISNGFNLHQLLEEDFFKRLSEGRYKRSFYPPFRERARWEKVLADFPLTKNFLKSADDIPAGIVPALPYSTYCDYQKNGSRVTYECPYFQRRRQLQILTIAMCLSGDSEKYMERILDHIMAILEEWSWTVPAHAFWTEAGTPDLTFRPTDLFCSETGTVMALSIMLIGEELEKASPGLCEKIRQITLQKTNYNVMKNTEYHWWYKDQNPQNWSIWCSFNNLFTAFVLEEDPLKLEQCVKGFLDLVNRYAVNYEDDGFCQEGPMYYTKSGLMFFRTLDLLEKVLPGSTEKIFSHEKVRAILQFIADVHVAGPMVASFGDAKPALNSTMGGILAAGKALRSRELLALNAFRNQEQLYGTGVCGDLLSEVMLLLFDLGPEILEGNTPPPPCSGTTYYKDHLGICRTKGFSAFIKAGNNGEPHNHNDLGHAGIYSGETPVIIDAGTGTYSKINFGPQRYTLWYTRGSGHNAPLINGMEQVYGREFCAALLKKGENGFLCDLTQAYPAEAQVQTFTRSLEVTEKMVLLEDTLSLKGNAPGEILLYFLTPQTVKELPDGDLLLGETLLHPEGITYIGQEPQEDLSSRESVNSWGNALTRLIFRTDRDHYKFVFTKPQEIR